MPFGKLLTAMVTPFNDKGEVCLDRTDALVEHLLATGTEGLVVAGTTGESPTLSKEEKLKLFEHIVKQVDGRVLVIAGTGNNNTAETAELTKAAEKTGVDGIMLVTPYYNKTNQRGLYHHFKTVAAATHLPVMIYNVPGRTAANVSASTTIELAKIDNIVSVKEASGNIDQITEILAHTPADFQLFSGDDGFTLPVLAVGGRGVVSVAAHVVGKEMSTMIEAYYNGDIKGAASRHQQLLPIFRELFAAPSPVPVKTLLNKMGVDVGDVRLPMVPLTDEEKQRLVSVYRQLT